MTPLRACSIFPRIRHATDHACTPNLSRTPVRLPSIPSSPKIPPDLPVIASPGAAETIALGSRLRRGLVERFFPAAIDVASAEIRRKNRFGGSVSLIAGLAVNLGTL